MKKLLCILILFLAITSCAAQTIPLSSVPVFLGNTNDSAVKVLADVAGLTRRVPFPLINKARLDSIATALALKASATATQAALDLKANVDVLATLSYAPTKNLDFSAANIQTINLTGDITFTASNYATGKQKALRIISDASSRNLTFPSGWVWLTDTPTSTIASKTGILSLYCFGSLETDVIASWVTQGGDL